jgi:uncharacterized protein YrzB (UPF0473 family)
LKKLSVLLVAFLFFYGCSYIYVKDDEEKAQEYSKIEIILSDFSKKIIAHYERQNIPIPKDFNEKQFIEVLEEVYPDKTKVELIKKDFKVKAHSLDNNYSVVLCDPDTGSKLMEDLSCHTTHVEIRFWDKEGIYPCIFEENWQIYCK